MRTYRRAVRLNVKLLVIERQISPPNEGAAAKFGDLNMLVGPGGRERTREEWTGLFATGGFRLVGATPTEAGLSVIEGVQA